MQIKKAGVVATGALATVAVMGAPAAAAPSMDATALTKASTLNLAKGGWGAPWDQEPQSVLAVGSGSVVQALAWQFCGSSAAGGVGAITVDLASPNSVFGDCNNGNIKLKQDTVPPVISVLNDTAISIGTIQACGSSVGVGAVAVDITLQSPSTVVGDCRNGNIIITREDKHDWHGGQPGHGYEESATVAEAAKSQDRKVWATRQSDAKAKAKTAAQAKSGDWAAPWDNDQQSLASIGSGSAVTALTWQACGADAVFGAVGVVLNLSSDGSVYGDCDNANVWIDQDDPTAVISILDNSRVSIGDWQVCGSTTGAGVGAITANLAAANTVYGNCNNANTIID